MTVFHHYYIIHGLFFILSILFILEKIGPNHFVGIRIGKALRNDKNWYKVHTFSGWSMLITSIVGFLYLLLLPVINKFIAPDMNVNTLCTIGGLFLLIIGYAGILAVYSFAMPDSDKE